VYFGHSASVPYSPQRAFGHRIRELRLATGMTQEDLAERCGLFRTYMSRIETGQANPTLTMIHALATSLGVAVPALFDARVEPRKPARPTARPSRGRVAK
jgi:transcriptional regulator with XRE-family HTH domain